MSTIQELQNRIQSKNDMIGGIKLGLQVHILRTENVVKHIEADIAQIEAEIAELKVNSPAGEHVPPCYYCGIEGACSCEYDAQQEEGCYHADENMGDAFHMEAKHEPLVEQRQSFPRRCERMKLKWMSNTNAETYRIAVVTKKGILEVKSVTDGACDCHNTHNCSCKPCREIRLSRGQLPAWRARAPLKKTFFPTEAAWRASLPEGGSVTQHSPVTDRQLKKLLKPLTATTDALKLKELEERFPDSKMLFSTGTVMHEVEYMGDDTGNHRIFSNTTCEIRSSFSDFGMKGKLNLMAEWKGLYIGLEHLF
jgi:hypothetical protein